MHIQLARIQMLMMRLNERSRPFGVAPGLPVRFKGSWRGELTVA